MRYDFLEVKSLARDSIFETSSDCMILMDSKSHVIDYNVAAAHFFLSINKPLTYKNIGDVLGDETELLHILKDETSHEFQLKHGERCFEIHTSAMHTTDGSRVGILKSMRDVTEKQAMEDMLRRMATIDDLSGLNNRHHFLNLSSQEFERAKRCGQPFSALIMDIDNFKSINDTSGHAAGDLVIREIGRLMKSEFRTTDILGRFGGEEFVAILANTAPAEALPVAERIRQAIAQAVVTYEMRIIRVTVSIGIAAYSGQASLQEILKHADQAMYQSKLEGRNRTTRVGR